MQIAIYAAKKVVDDSQLITKTPEILRGMIGKLQKDMGLFSMYIVVWDTSGGSAWRKVLAPEYKSGRSKVENLVEITKASKQVFSDFLIESVEVGGSEADDIIYVLAELYKKKHPCDITIVSRDKDLIQVVQDGYADRIWDVVSKKYIEIPSYNITLYKALVGDKSDGLKGIPGVGDKKARKLIKEGFNKSLISETFLVVHIPSNPLYPEFKKILTPFVNGDNAWGY